MNPLNSLFSTHVRKGLGSAVVFFGSLAVVKSMQDARYLKKDMKSISNTELTETDLEVYRDKYKLSDDEMAKILAAAKAKKKAVVENVYENDPNFQHKRTAGRDD